MNKKIKLLQTLFFLHISHLTASQAQQPQAQQSQEVTYFSMCVPFAVVTIKANKSSDPQVDAYVKSLSKLYGFTKLDR